MWIERYRAEILPLVQEANDMVSVDDPVQLRYLIRKLTEKLEESCEAVENAYFEGCDDERNREPSSRERLYEDY